MSSITINAAASMPLRPALYTELAHVAGELGGLLQQPDREESCQAWAACLRLREVASLLDRIGWRSRDARVIELKRRGDVQMVLSCLAIELEVAADQACSAREFGEEQRVLAAEERCESVHDAMCAVETAAQTAGLLDAKEAGDGRA